MSDSRMRLLVSSLLLVLAAGCTARVQNNVRTQRISTENVVSPESDSDHDGVPASRDQCPNAAEDRDHVADIDGCPEVDQDCDGIADAQDLCAEHAEDRDGFQDSDGCPDPDNDGDRVVDVCDQCPGNAETYNGNNDEDGCPESLVEIRSELRIIPPTLYFARNSAALRSASIRILTVVAALIQQHRQIEQIAIVAHSSRAERNPDALSVRRARVVREWLLAHGVQPARLIERAAGVVSGPVGPGMPAVREQFNQRVEFVLLRSTDGELMRWDGHTYVAVERPAPTPVQMRPADCQWTEPTAMHPGGCPLPDPQRDQ